MLRLRGVSIAPVICFAMLAGCSQPLPFASNSTGQTSTTVNVPESTPSATPAPVSSPTPDSQRERDYLGEATSRADRATRMAQNALSKDDWTLVVNAYQQAINLLKQVPQKDVNYTKAQTKLKEYQANLASARSKRDRLDVAAATPAPNAQPAKPASQTPTGRTPTTPARNAQPVRPVSQAPAAMTAQQFLENVYFNRVINEGATGSSLWCESKKTLQSSLFAPRSYQILSIVGNEESASATVRIESSNRSGQPIINNWSFVIYKERTTGEQLYLNRNDPESAQILRDSNGGWCIAMISER